jgi:hypothetical protein
MQCHQLTQLIKGGLQAVGFVFQNEAAVLHHHDQPHTPLTDLT